MNKIDRYKVLVRHIISKGLATNQKDLGRKLGYTNESAFSQIINEKVQTPKDFIDRLKTLLPELNAEWIMEGKGEMFKTEEFNSESDCNCEEVVYVPLLPLASKGGSIDECTSSAKPADCELILSPTPYAQYAITIRGDSMYPEYPNGTIAFIKEIDADLFIEWGRSYVLDTYNGSVTKVLVPSSREGYVRCLSLNPDERFAPFEVPLKAVRKIYKILLSINPK